MPQTLSATPAMRLTSRSGMSVEINANGSVRRFDCAGISLNLFVGSEVEGGPANLYLRSLGESVDWTTLLGPRSPTRFHSNPGRNMLVGTGRWRGIKYSVTLVLADGGTAWFWHVRLENTASLPQSVDLMYAQDVALAPYAAVRLNEYYVSQYVDHTPLDHPAHGCVLASRQNMASGARNPWCAIGSLRKAVSFATDALQVHGLSSRAGRAPLAVVDGLPGRRLQHEHSMVAVQDALLRLEPGASAAAGFFGSYMADHPDATSSADLERVAEALALPEAAPVTVDLVSEELPASETLFSSAPHLLALDLEPEALQELFGPQWRHEERDERGELLSFFHGADCHVALRAKELRVQRPHGHLLRTGRHLTPDETALTSTAWMNGVFHSMLTQGHVSINRFLSTVHSYLGLFRSHGQRVFAEIGGIWRLLDVPSAFEMQLHACRWIYRHRDGAIEVHAQAQSDPHALTLSIEVRSGAPMRFLVCNHVSLNGDDGSAPGAARWWREGEDIIVAPAPETDLAHRFPDGCFGIAPESGTAFEQVGGDDLLFVDGKSRLEPYLCIVTARASRVGLRLTGRLLEQTHAPLRFESHVGLAPKLTVVPPAAGALADRVERIAEIAPWFAHNAMVHYLSPRGLEQYSGGGWGTRDVCQGPVELLVALGRTEPVRDLLLRVFRAQNADGDWPQWFMFFERERSLRAADSHGDIVFWPLLALAQYLIASGDAALLDERVAFFAPDDSSSPEQATVWQHAQRALAVIERRVIPGTALAAYGHGDWNDALQPADPAMREHMCSAWTVTLHHQTLLTLARALRTVGRDEDATRLEQWGATVRRDFQRFLLVDGVLAGYALFEDRGSVRYLLHPRDRASGVRYSALPMIHAVLEDMLTPAQAREHLKLIETHLSGPDGVRLFDRPMPYHGGPQRLFQRAESATFFGREIGLMYTHAHLRYAQALAHVGDAEGFFRALCQANAIGIRAIAPSATLRQANCYYSSSDAAFADRYQASAEYERVARGTIGLDGGWRVYSSGAGIAFALILRRFLGLSFERGTLSLDPVMPAALDGLLVETTLLGKSADVTYRVAGAGCGVSEVVVNGRRLTLTHEANPYRRGAALVRIAEVLGLLGPQRNSVQIRIGQRAAHAGGNEAADEA